LLEATVDDSKRWMKAQRNFQIAWGHDGYDYRSISLPCPFSEVIPGVNWGLAEDVFTPAFWKYQTQLKRMANGEIQDFRLGFSLLEEVSVCLLGGYGMPAELGLAAFKRLRDQGLLDGTARPSDIENALSDPFDVFGKPRKYRFARQKSRYLANSLGPKTASWVVRNYFGSDDVAILDVHIVRAGIEFGLFKVDTDPSRNYYELENRLLMFCAAIEEPVSFLDAIMWDYMRRIGPTANRRKSRVH